MKDSILIQLLQSENPDENNKALQYIIQHKQHKIIQKLRIPSHLGKDSIFNHALVELLIYVRKNDFDTSKEDSIERFLYVVCRRYISGKSGNGDGNLDGIPEPPSPDDPISSLMNAEIREKLEEIISQKLSPVCWIILISKHEGLSDKEISLKTGHTVDGVKVKRHKCMKKLKELIDENPDLRNYIKGLLDND